MRPCHLQPLDVVGHGLDVLLTLVHPGVERVVGGAAGHGDVLVHVELEQQLLLSPWDQLQQETRLASEEQWSVLITPISTTYFTTSQMDAKMHNREREVGVK